MGRGDLPPQGGCPTHGPECKGDCARPVEKEKGYEKSKEMLAKLGDVHWQIVEALRKKFESEGPLGRGEWGFEPADGIPGEQGTFTDHNPSSERDSIFAMSLEGGTNGLGGPDGWQLNFTIDKYRARPEPQVPYTASLTWLQQGKKKDEIALEFYYHDTRTKIAAVPRLPKVKRFDGSQVMVMHDDGVHLADEKLLLWQGDFDGLKRRVLAHPLVKKSGTAGAESDDVWEAPRTESVQDLKNIWEQARKGFLGKVRYKPFEEEFPQARSLGKKPEPIVVTHQKFQERIQAHASRLEEFSKGLGKGKISLAKPPRKPRP